MPSEKEISLSIYRLERAKEMLCDAGSLFEKGSYKSSNNRAYYSIFHAMRAVLALRNIDFKKHSAVIQYFQKEYVKTKIFGSECSDIIMSASKIRNSSDYDDFFIASRDETQKQLKNAETFYEIINMYIINIVK